MYPNGRVCKNSEIYNLHIGSQVLFADLIKKGVVPNKSLKLNFQPSPIHMLAILSGGILMEMDGCVYIERKIGQSGQPLIRSMRVIFTSGSQQFLTGLANALKRRVGIFHGRIYYEYRAFRLVYMAGESKLLAEFMYQNKGGLFLPRKYEIFEHFRKVRQMDASVVK